MPEVELVPFLSSETTQMRACISGQCDWGATSTASESLPSAAEPISQATNPPKRDRHAEPEPWREIRESSEADVGRAYSAAREDTRAAKPAAEDASPAAVGKLFTDDICTANVESYEDFSMSIIRQSTPVQRTLGIDGFLSSTCRLRLFISRIHVANLPPSLISSSTPFNHSLSFSKDGSARDVVVDRKWSWSSVTESEEFVGRISFVSLFPQYLSRENISDKLRREVSHSLDACNVHGRRGGSFIDGHRKGGEQRVPVECKASPNI